MKGFGPGFIAGFCAMLLLFVGAQCVGDVGAQSSLGFAGLRARNRYESYKAALRVYHEVEIDLAADRAKAQIDKDVVAARKRLFASPNKTGDGSTVGGSE